MLGSVRVAEHHPAIFEAVTPDTLNADSEVAETPVPPREEDKFRLTRAHRIHISRTRFKMTRTENRRALGKEKHLDFKKATKKKSSSVWKDGFTQMIV